MAAAYKLTGMMEKKPPAGIPRNNPYYMVMAECDMVVMLRQQWAPDPQKPGKFYEYFAPDVFHIKDGKLYEHWDGAMIPDPVPKYLQISVNDLQSGKR
jgi:predicted SnoaL-like aldol condensation-catalyzing enzyme